MEIWLEKYNHIVSENSIWSWLSIVFVSVLLTFLIKFVFKVISTRLRKFAMQTESMWDDIGLDLIDGLKSFVLFSWVFFALSAVLSLTSVQEKVILFFVVVFSVYQLSIWGLYVIKSWKQQVLDKRISTDPSSAAALGLLYTAMQLTFLSTILLIGLSNLGVDITAMIAGLGVGGIAIALAAQNVLGDLLASLSIVLDKPFVVGDFVITNDEIGTVEHIGIKTTRLRSLSGEELVLSNKDLIESRIRNYKKMFQRRVVQKFGVVYSTPVEALEQIPQWVRGFVEKHEKLKFDRCHFAKYGDSSLDFELVFYVLDPEYNVFMDLQQSVLLDIFRKFSEAKVDFAFPTQTLHIEKVPPLQ